MAAMGDRDDSSLTVSAYSQKFFQSYSDSIEPSSENVKNKQVAGQTLINLVKKLHEAGSKDDIKVPLRVLRDEIGRIYFGSVQQRDLRIEKLFQLYDALEEGAQEEIRTRSAKESAWAQAALEELRQRFSRLVVGDTWETYPELKLKALQHLYTYWTKEKAEKQSVSSAAPRQGPALSSNRLGMKKLSRSFSGTPQTSSTWQSTFDDLGKAPGNRLLPLLKLLLSAGKPASEAPAELTAPDTPQEPLPSPGTPESQNKGNLRTQPSGVSDGGLGRPIAELDLNMDDLLGLNDKGVTTAKPQDPFRASFEEPRPSVQPSSAPAQPGQQSNPPPTEPSRTSISSNPELNNQAVPAYNPVGSQRQQAQQNGAPQPYIPQTYAPQPPAQQQYAPQQFPSQAYAGQSLGQGQPGVQGPRDLVFNRQASGGFYNNNNSIFGDPSFNRQTSGGYGHHNPADTNFARQTSGGFANYAPADPNFLRQAPHPHAGYNAGQPPAAGGSAGFGNVPPQLKTAGTAGSNPGSFNPFDLPSPTYASPVPKDADNTFAEFSPVAGAPPQPRIPNPMRNAPEPPNKNVSSPTTAPQAPRSSFSSW